MDINELLGVKIDNIGDYDIPEDSIKIPFESFADINNVAGAVLKEFKEVNQFKGVVKMSYDKGLGELQRAKAGGYTGNIINEKGRIVGHVNLEDVSNAAAVTGSAMQIMSVITSQYYLHEINKSLNDIQSKVDTISHFLETDKRSHLTSRELYLLDLQKNLIDIQSNPVETQAVLTQLQNIEIEAYSDYMTISEMISASIDAIDSAKKQDDILELIEKINDYIPQLWCSLYLYVYSKYLRLILSGSVDKKRIDNLYDELTNMIAKYEQQMSDYDLKALVLVKDNDAYKVNDVIFDVAKGLGGGFFIKNKAIDEVKEMVQDKKDEQRTKALAERFDAFYYTKDTEPIKKICEDIKFYNVLYNEPVDFILDDEDIYIVHGKNSKNNTEMPGK